MHSIAKNLKQIRQQRGWTQQQMADVLFVTRQTVSNWENGKSMPDLDMLTSIAEKLNVDVNELLYGIKPVSGSQLNRNIKISLILLVAGLILKRLSRYFTLLIKYSFCNFPEILSLGIASPLIAFSCGMMMLQLLKATNIISHIPVFIHRKKIQISILLLITIQFLIVLPYYYKELLMFLSILLKDTFLIDMLLNMYYGSSYIVNDIHEFIFMQLTNKIFTGDVLYPIFFAVSGFMYELVVPFTGPVNANDYPLIVNIRKVINNPQIIVEKIKSNYPLYGKRTMVCSAVFLLLFSAQAIIRFLTGHHITSGYVINYILQGFIKPGMWIISGYLIAMCCIMTGINYNKKFVHKLFALITVVILAANIAVYIPYIIKDMIALSTGQSPVEYLKQLLDAPRWYRAPYNFFVNLSRSTFRNKFFVYTLPAFIAGITKE